MIHPRLLEAIAYGDARGLPYETRTKEEIMSLGGVSTKLIEPAKHSKFPDFIDHPVGTWSDDTQHSLVVAESLITQQSYDLRDIALRLKGELGRALGWGRTTKTAIARVHEGMTNEELAENGEANSNGCGPLMRSLPLAVYSACSRPEVIDKIAIESAGLTHNSAENIASTLVHHNLLTWLINRNRHSEATDFMLYAYRLAKRYEHQLGARPELSARIQRAGLTDDLSDVYGGTKWGAFATWSVQAVAYGALARRLHGDLEKLISEVIEEGGDADSTASIAAGMWALANPSGRLPNETEKLVDLDRLRRASCGLIDLYSVEAASQRGQSLAAEAI